MWGAAWYQHGGCWQKWRRQEQEAGVFDADGLLYNLEEVAISLIGQFSLIECWESSGGFMSS
jgi:hypothetical protein